MRIASASLSLVLLSGLVANPELARAEPSPFLIADRPSTQSAFGVDLSITNDTENFGDIFGVRIDPHVEHLFTPQVGVMATLPMAILAGDDFDTEFAIANLEAGAFYATNVAPAFDLVLRGSITLPTAEDELLGLLDNVINTFSRLNDYVLIAPQTFALRLSGSLIHPLPGMLLRVDAGLDLPVADTLDGGDIDNDPLLRFGASLGIGASPVVTLELANLYATGADDGESMLTQLGVGAAFGQGSGNAIKVGLSMILDTLWADDTDLFLGQTTFLALTVGGSFQ